jgi:hypothetical protein
MKKVLIVLVVTIFSLTIIPLAVNADDSISIQLYSNGANIWFFHYGKTITWYLMEDWPKNFVLTKIGPSVLTLSKDIALVVAAGPDFLAEGKSLFQSFTLDVVPVIGGGVFSAVFINEAGINRDGKAIYFFRHSITCKNIGLRWSGFGIFGQKMTNLQIGPMVKYQASKKFSLEGWVSINPHNREKKIELVFNIDL